MLKSNKLNMVISLVIAIVLWMYVVGQVDPKTNVTIDNVGVKFLNAQTLERNGLAMANPSETKVDVTLSGKRAVVSKVKAADIEAYVDLYGEGKGKARLKVNVKTPKNTKVERLSTDHITVNIENLVSASKQVRAVFKGGKSGEEAGNVTVSPSRVIVSGAESLIGKTSHVEATVDASKVKREPTTVSATARPVDDKGRTVRYVNLSSDSISVSATMMKKKTVPLSVKTVGEVGRGYVLESVNLPKKITVKGDSDAIENIDSLTADDVDISGVTHSITLPINVNLPEGVVLANKSKKTGVKVNVKAMATKTYHFSGDDIQAQGLVEGLSARVNSNVSVTIRGVDSAMSGLVKSDITLSVNLGRYDEAGTFSVKVNVRCDKEVFQKTASPQYVRVIISEG